MKQFPISNVRYITSSEATWNLFLLTMVKEPALDPHMLPVANCEENLNPGVHGDPLRVTGTVGHRLTIEYILSPTSNVTESYYSLWQSKVAMYSRT